MSVQAISSEIISKYQNLNKIAYIKPKDNVRVPFWLLRMEKWGVSQGLGGNIWCLRKLPKKNVEPQWRVVTPKQIKRENKRTYFIDANIGKDDVKINVKPFWMREIKALERINQALTEFINNYKNDDVVEKGEVPVVIHTKEHIDFLLGKNPDFKYVKYED